MAKTWILALLCMAGCGREAPPPAIQASHRLPPVTDQETVSAPAPMTKPQGRITYRLPPTTEVETQAAQAVIRWLDQRCTEPYDVDLSVSTEPSGNGTSVVIIYQSRDEQDRPLTAPGAHALVTVGPTGEVERIIGGR